MMRANSLKDASLMKEVLCAFMGPNVDEVLCAWPSYGDGNFENATLSFSSKDRIVGFSLEDVPRSAHQSMFFKHHQEWFFQEIDSIINDFGIYHPISQETKLSAKFSRQDVGFDLFIKAKNGHKGTITYQATFTLR